MNASYFYRLWRWVRWVLLALFIGLVALVALRFPHAVDQQRTEQTIAEIHATKLTRDDVLGTLPPPPDPTLNNSTIAGIDANHNGIRDDVEIAIYEAHKDSASVTAAEYQYAMAIQLMLTDVYNSDTWIAAAQEVSRAYDCVGQASESDDLTQQLNSERSRISEVENLMYNTPQRIAAKDNAYSFTTTNADLPGDSCDIDLSTLPN